MSGRMHYFSYSVRSHVLSFITLMGLAALLLVVATAWAYRHFSWESQRLAFSRLAELEVIDLLEELKVNSADLAIRLQHPAEFREAYRQRDKDTLIAHLNDQFRQYYHTAGIIRIRKIQLFDPQLQLIVESIGAEKELPAGQAVCPSLMKQASLRTGSERLKPIATLCLVEGIPYYSVLAPVGGLQLSGYLLVASDPAPLLQQVETELGASIHLRDAHGESRYHLDPHQHGEETVYLPVEYRIFADNGELAYRLDIEVDITDFERQTKRGFGIILAIAVGVTLLAMLVAGHVFRRSTILPLERLSSHLERIRSDNSLLGEPLAPDGNREIRDLAVNLNEMSAELASMRERLRGLAYNDTLTGAANRLAFNSKLQHLTGNQRRREDEGFSLFVIDLNKFKKINDEYGHDVGDLLLQGVVIRMQQALRESDMVARLGGDEFAVILPGSMDEAQVARVAENLIGAVEMPLPTAAGELLPSLSIGISLYPDTTVSREALLKSADHAMYQAKQAGGGYCIAPPCPPECQICAGEAVH